MSTLPRCALATAVSLCLSLGVLAAQPGGEAPPAQPSAAAVGAREAIPEARDPWTVLERLPEGWDDRLRAARPAAGGTARTLRFHFEGARSLAAAVDALVCRHGLFVNYEDAPWIAEQDTQLVFPAKDEDRARIGVRAPASDLLDFQYQEDVSTQLPLDAQALLEQVVEEHRQQGGHGRFRVERLNDGIASVVPSEALDQDGRWVAIEPVLSAKITIPDATRSVEDLFDLVLGELNRTSRYRIGYGALPLNAVHQTVVDFGAHDEAARDVLVRALRALPYRYYVTMNFDPASRTYFLNVVPPRRAELCPREGAEPVPATQIPLRRRASAARK